MIKNIIKKLFGKRIIHRVEEYYFRGNLNKLAQIYNTDKYGRHLYTLLYSEVFKRIRNKKLKILEIGVGGYENPLSGGASLKMWKRYFYNSQIYAIDIYDKSKLQEKRIKIYRGSQDDSNFLEQITMETGTFDIIIDDGSHINSHVISSFKFLFPNLNEGGIYIVEDTQTSYRDDTGGDSKSLENPKTTMNFFKKLIDAVNHEEFDNDLFEFNLYVKNIKSIQFYHNIIFIFKK